MTSDIRQPSAGRLLFGLGITLFGIVLLLDRLGISRPDVLLKFWPLGLVLFGGVVVLQALRGRRGYGGYARPRRSLFGLAMWVLILGAVFSGVFRDNDRDVVRADTGGRARMISMLNRDQRVDTTGQFRGADMTALMGGSSLDLSHAVLLPGQTATIDVLALMGGVVLRVPDDWEVDVRVTPVMGGVRDQRWRSQASADGDAATVGPAPRLIVKGVVVMGGFVIKS
jgi:hypothetical protein